MPRFLNAHTGEFVQLNLDRSDEEGGLLPQPRYAVLSHTWNTGGEQTYAELLEIQTAVTKQRAKMRPGPSTRPLGSGSDARSATSAPEYDEALPSVLRHPDISPKIREFCRVAREAGYELVWQDACCIDKSSSMELSEAIRSMFEWYRRADICYVYLADVPDGDIRVGWINAHFWKSRWHKRGWTLQELIAPERVVFLTKTWRFLGSKMSLAKTLQGITGIDFAILTGTAPLESISVARRMWWASERETTRIEDRAYCLMGLFGVHLPVMYGEGQNAFLRLQEEIVRTIPDQSIFAWGRPRNLVPQAPGALFSPTLDTSAPGQGLLAPDSSYFGREAGGITPLSDAEFARRLGLPSDSFLPPLHCLFTLEGVRIELLCLDPSVLPRGMEILSVAHQPWLIESEPAGSQVVTSLVGDQQGAVCGDPDCKHLGYTHLLAFLRCRDSCGSIVSLPLLKQRSRTEILPGFRYCFPYPNPRGDPSCSYRTVYLTSCETLGALREQGSTLPGARSAESKELLIRASDRFTTSVDTPSSTPLGQDTDRNHGFSGWNATHSVDLPQVAVDRHSSEDLHSLGIVVSTPTIQRMRPARLKVESLSGERLHWVDLPHRAYLITTDLRPNGREGRQAQSISLKLTTPDTRAPLTQTYEPKLAFEHHIEREDPRTGTSRVRIPLPSNGKPITFYDNVLGCFGPSFWRRRIGSNAYRIGLEQPLLIPLHLDWERRDTFAAQLLRFSFDLTFHRQTGDVDSVLLWLELSGQFQYSRPAIDPPLEPGSGSDGAHTDARSASGSALTSGSPAVYTESAPSARPRIGAGDSVRDSTPSSGSEDSESKAERIPLAFAQTTAPGVRGPHAKRGCSSSEPEGEHGCGPTHHAEGSTTPDQHSSLHGTYDMPDANEGQAGETGADVIADVLRRLAVTQKDAKEHKAKMEELEVEVGSIRRELDAKHRETEDMRREMAAARADADAREREADELKGELGVLKSQMAEILSRFQHRSRRRDTLLPEWGTASADESA